MKRAPVASTPARLDVDGLITSTTDELVTPVASGPAVCTASGLACSDLETAAGTTFSTPSVSGAGASLFSPSTAVSAAASVSSIPTASAAAALAAPAPALPATRFTRRAFVGAAGLAAAGLALGSSRFAHAAETVGASGSDAAPADTVIIFHTNDTHGYLQGDGESVVGIDLVAGLRAATPNSLLLDAGDATQGAPLASLTKGTAPIELMSAAGYDAMCLGNHEFDFGLDNLLANAEAASFPLLAANVLLDGAPLLAASAGIAPDASSASAPASAPSPDAPAGTPGSNVILTCAGRRIGVFGLTTQATAWSASPSALEGVTFADEVATAQAQIAELASAGVDAIVCLAHLGNGPVPCTGPALAQSLPPEAASRLTAIIDGHSHTVENELVNGVLVVQTGCNLAALGKLTLTFAADGTVSASEELLDPAAVAAQATPNADVAQDLADIAADQDEMLSEKLAVNPTTLWAGWLDGNDLAAPTRMVETNYGDFVCECFINRASAFLAQAGLDDGTPLLAVTNGGGIRAALPRGIVEVRDLVTAFPFSNTVQVKRVTPKILRSLFEGSFATMTGQDAQTGMLLQETISGGFLQLAGFEVTCDPNAPVGQRVTDIYVYGLGGSVDLDDDETPLYLASNSYVMAGGDAYEPLANAEMVAEVGGELEAIRAYLDELTEALGRGIGLRCLPLLPGTKGRLILDGGYEPTSWVATLRLTDEAGEPLANTNTLLDVDAGGFALATSDADGYVHVELEDGPHAIAAFSPEGIVALGYGIGGTWPGIGYDMNEALAQAGLLAGDAAGSTAGMREGERAASSSGAGDTFTSSERLDGRETPAGIQGLEFSNIATVVPIPGLPNFFSSFSLIVPRDEAGTYDGLFLPSEADDADGVAVSARAQLSAAADGVAQVGSEVRDGANGVSYALPDRREATGMAVGRALLEPAAGEAYVDNHMGIGLIEDDLRAFPTVTLSPINEELVRLLRDAWEQAKEAISGHSDATEPGSSLVDEPLSSAEVDRIRAVYEEGA